jgi:hypothetical protein
MTAPIQPGTCRYCGCTDDREHRLADGDPCCWIDAKRTLCSAPGCIRQAHVDDMNARRRDFLRLSSSRSQRHKNRRRKKAT